jgi:hypothetical protein
MLFKWIILLLLLCVLVSLGSGLFYLVRDRGTTQRTVRALTLRISLSLLLFILLLIGFIFGFITPHGI